MTMCTRSGRLRLGLVWCAVWPCVAIAHETPAAHGSAGSGQVFGSAPTYSCVDSTDASARRRVQTEPCKLPMYQLPVTQDPAVHPSRSWPRYPARSLEADAPHPMFWRFPVQPLGPHEVPRHSRR